MFILGLLAHYTDEEIIKDKHLQYIASVLKKKHFDLKNGNAKLRITLKTQPKNEAQQKELTRAIYKMKLIKEAWDLNTHIADKAWKTTAEAETVKHDVTTTDLIVFLLEKEASASKWYGFNKKKLEAFKKTSPLFGKYGYRSLRVVNELVKQLEIEIAHYNYNNLKKVA